MLKIQVLGKGLIPRGHGIAPKLEPFPADLTLIGTIIGTPGLSLNYIHPETGRPMKLTRENYQSVYKKFKDGNYSKPTIQQSQEIKPKAVENKQLHADKVGVSDSVEFTVHMESEEVKRPLDIKKDNNAEIKPITSNDTYKNYDKNNSRKK